jgi:hypothetical protein
MIAEKQGWLFAPRNIFGFSIPQWGYNWGYSNAYLEILITDTVILDFGDKKKVTKYDIEKTKEIWNKNKKNRKRWLGYSQKKINGYGRLG